MRERGYRVPVYLTLEEKEDLHEKASAACMDHNRFIRMLIAGYDPRPAPDWISSEEWVTDLNSCRTL